MDGVCCACVRACESAKELEGKGSNLHIGGVVLKIPNCFRVAQWPGGRVHAEPCGLLMCSRNPRHKGWLSFCPCFALVLKWDYG